MKLLKVIGTHDASIKYVDRPTVKTLVLNSDNKILIINEGLLPGGGVENDESNFTALNRELLEEIGIEVTDQQEIGCVVQYRDFLKRKYLVYGYTSLYKDTVAIPTPQDDREANLCMTGTLSKMLRDFLKPRLAKRLMISRCLREATRQASCLTS